MWPTEPQRHREGTEKAQSHPLTSQTRRHEDTKASQRPPLNVEARRRGGAEGLSRACIAWRGPGRQTTAGDRWAGPTLRSQAIVAVSRPSGPRSESAGLATPPLHFTIGRGAPPFQIGERRGGTDALPARRPMGSLAATNACVRSSRASYRRSAIARSPAVPPSILGTAHHIGEKPFVSSCLRVCDVDGRLCVSAFLGIA